MPLDVTPSPEPKKGEGLSAEEALKRLEEFRPDDKNPEGWKEYRPGEKGRAHNEYKKTSKQDKEVPGQGITNLGS